MNQRPILVVEDSDTNFETLTYSFKNEGIRNELVRCCSAAETAEYLLGSHALACMALVDLGLPDARGVEVIHVIRKICPPKCFLLLSTTCRTKRRP